MRTNRTISIDTATWVMLGRLAKSFGISRSRVIDWAVLTMHEQSEDGTIPPPQRYIHIGREDEE